MSRSCYRKLAVSDNFIRIIATCERLNVEFAQWVRKQTSFPSLKAQGNFFLNTVSAFYRRPSSHRPEQSALQNLLAKVGLEKRLVSSELDDICRFLVRPKSLHGDDNVSRSDATTPFLANIDPPFRFTKLSLYIYNLYGTHVLAEVNIPGATVSQSPINRLATHQEVLDPIQIARAYFLQTGMARSSQEASSFVQREILDLFGLHFDAATRQCVITISEKLNDLFYCRKSLSTGEYHTANPSLIGPALVVETISKSVEEFYQTSSEGDSLRKAIGFFLLLRFCGLFRNLYTWEEKEAAEKSTLWQLVSPIRAMKPTYILVRSFGSIGDIAGLNYVFRGAILPRLGTGRTMVIDGPTGAGKTVLALQKVCTIASKGGFSAYFSLEESYELIVARLETFGLLSSARFRVVDLFTEQKRYPRLVGQELINAVVDAHCQRDDHRGLLLFYSDPGSLGEDSDNSGYDLIEALRFVAGSGRGHGFRYIAACIDSLNALATLNDNTSMHRSGLARLVRTLEHERILGIIVSENAERNCPSLPFLSDTFIRVGFGRKNRVRWLRVEKCRSQDYHPGMHPFRLVEGEGVRIYPSLSAVLSSLRFRTKSTLSKEGRIPIPGWLSIDASRKVNKIAEKSSLLIYGDANCRKTRIALEMALWQPSSREDLSSPNLLVITFQTSEKRFEQEIRAKAMHKTVKQNSSSSDTGVDKALSNEDDPTWIAAAWNSLKHYSIRWYSPGENLTPEQIISNIRGFLKHARGKGTPIRRVIVDELESAELMLPKLREQPLFWATLVQLLATEALTSFFIFGRGHQDSEIFRAIFLEVDYALTVIRDSERKRSQDQANGHRADSPEEDEVDAQRVDSNSVEGSGTSDGSGRLKGLVVKYPDQIDEATDYGEQL